MKLQSIKLRGFIGIKKGLGLEEIDLDLSGLNGLVAFDGPNGRGKSSLLENLQPFRTLASRKKALQHHVFLKDSFKDLSFSFEGNEYRTLIKIDADSEKQEGFIWQNGASQVNGKVTEYDKYIKNLLGSPGLFFNSVFCAQNSEKISDLTTGELKGLFSEFLRLDRLIEYENTSKQCSTILRGKLENVNTTIEGLNDTLLMESPLKIDLADLASKRARLKKEKDQLKADIDAAEYLLNLARERAEANKLIRERLKDKEKEWGILKNETETDKTQCEAELAEIREKAQSACNEIAATETLLKDKEKIEEAIKQEKDAQDHIDLLTENIGTFTEETAQISTTINEREKEHISLRAEWASLDSDSEAQSLDSEIRTLTDQLTTLGLRDPECQSKTCDFITQALDAEKRLPELKITLFGIKSRITAKKIEIEDKNAALVSELVFMREDRAKNEKRLNTAQSIIESKKVLLKEAQEITINADKIKIAESKLHDLTIRKKELISMGLTAKDRWEKIIAAKETRQADIEKEIQAAKAKINEKAEDDIITQARIISDIKETLEKSEKEDREISGKAIAIETRLKELETSKQALTAASEKRGKIITEISEWKYLKDACSKDGLRAIEIDSAAPAISGHANNLLNQTFGPMFSIRFRTQDDSGGEVLDIMVISDDGSEVLLDNLSGGERVWCLKALRLAMTMLSKEKSGREYKTILCDEEDGALSKENAVNFINMYRKLLKLADMDTCYFISHRRKALNLADHRLLFSDKGIEIH